MKPKYINPFIDFGFKKIFGEEASKPQLTDFLNSILPAEDKIASLSYKNTEQLAFTDLERKAVYAIYCENEKGEKFIVELQKAKQNYFKERTIYYSTFPIREQTEKGNWNFNLKTVYCIGLLDFTFDDYKTESEKNEVLHTIKLKYQHGKIFYDKLTYIYLEMPNFKLSEDKLNTRLDKWLYFINNLEDLENIPTLFNDIVFEQAFEKAELSKLTREESDKYDMNLKVYRDNKNTLDYTVETAFDKGKIEGKIEGIKEGKIETAKKLKNLGISIEVISQSTGLRREEIEKIKI
jgi:predicted transposase/invertase (TIGR01784 family)